MIARELVRLLVETPDSGQITTRTGLFWLSPKGQVFPVDGEHIDVAGEIFPELADKVAKLQAHNVMDFMFDRGYARGVITGRRDVKSIYLDGIDELSRAQRTRVEDACFAMNMSVLLNNHTIFDMPREDEPSDLQCGSVAGWKAGGW